MIYVCIQRNIYLYIILQTLIPTCNACLTKGHARIKFTLNITPNHQESRERHVADSRFTRAEELRLNYKSGNEPDNICYDTYHHRREGSLSDIADENIKSTFG